MPDKPIAVEELDGPKAYHDIAFDDQGNLIGSDNTELLKAALGGKPRVFIPGIGAVEGMDTFSNGDLLAVIGDFSRTGGVVRITPSGGQDVLAPAKAGSYGVLIGPDGFIYLAQPDSLLRIDPETRKTTLVPSNVEGWTPRVMDYNPEKTRLYVGTIGDGTVYYYDLDATGSPRGLPNVFAKGVGGYHDGLGVDACGNVFVADFTETALYRITPDGRASIYQDWAPTTEMPSNYGHGLEWGSGKGGFEKNSLYLPQPYDRNTVVRVDVGVPARPR